MKTKITKSGAWIIFEKQQPSGMYHIKLYTPGGELHDEFVCDTYEEAEACFRKFNAIARAKF